LPVDSGFGNARFQRWYFDGKRCSPFDYNGIGGNDNRFSCKEMCEKHCGRLQSGHAY